MKTTLYDALGVARHASQQEIQAALRGHVRKYLSHTRDGHGNLEEALRFINHASCILTDPERRAAYDQELALSGGSLEQRIKHVVDAVSRDGDKGPTLPSKARGDASSLRSAMQSSPAPTSVHPALVEPVGSLPQATSVAIAACASFIVLIAAAIVFVTPSDALSVARHLLISLTVTLSTLALVYGIVHLLVARRRQRDMHTAQTSQDERAVLNWRREKCVFFGTQPPQEDAGWIFKLRMAELERSKLGRTSAPRPWNRLGARLFDYALWGLTLAALLTQLRSLDLVSSSAAYWLMHPLLAPMLICATWIPIETLFMAYARTTPGKWLFGVYVQFSISDPYALRDRRSQLRRAFMRACHVWWGGIGCGIPLLAPVLMALAYDTVAREQETPWDAAEDCLVTHAPPAGVNTATGVAGFVAMLWLYGVAWQPVMEDSITRARSSVIAVLPSQAFLQAALSQRGGTIIDSVRGFDIQGLQRAAVRSSSPPSAAGDRKATVSAPIDPDLAKLFAERKARIETVRGEGLHMLQAKKWRRAKELCREWVDLELGNSEAWRCVGQALQHEGRHHEAVNALRKAKQFDPDDRTLDLAISRSQNAIVAQFLSTAR